MVNGTNLDITSASVSLTEAFINAKVVTLHQLISLAGPNLIEVYMVATQLGVRSTRMIRKLLQKIQTLLTVDERDSLNDIMKINDKDLFPKSLISSNLDEYGEFFLKSEHLMHMDFEEVNGNTLYK